MAVIIRDCPHCPAENSPFQIAWTVAVPNQSRPTWNCAATCSACSGPICFVAFHRQGGPTPPPNHSGNLEPTFVVQATWPAKAVALAPPHAPPGVKLRFEEAEDAFGRGKWNSAVAMYRSSLDIATKGMDGVPKEVTFFKRLEWLHNKRAITPDVRAWADPVRVEGNAALHDPEVFDQEDAKVLRFFTEMFLRYVFELPGAVREFRGEPQSTTPPMANS